MMKHLMNDHATNMKIYKEVVATTGAKEKKTRNTKKETGEPQCHN